MHLGQHNILQQNLPKMSTLLTIHYLHCTTCSIQLAITYLQNTTYNKLLTTVPYITNNSKLFTVDYTHNRLIYNTLLTVG